MFEEINASSLVKVNLEGRKVMPSPYDINPAGFTIHSAVHAARENALCVMHIHSPNGVAVSAQRNGLLPISQQSTIVLSSLAYHDYEGIALDEKNRVWYGTSATRISLCCATTACSPLARRSQTHFYSCIRSRRAA